MKKTASSRPTVFLPLATASLTAAKSALAVVTLAHTDALFFLQLLDKVISLTVAIVALYLCQKRIRHQRARLAGLKHSRNQADVLRKFSRIRAKTMCPFAAKARLMAGTLGTTGEFNQSIREVIPALVKLTELGRPRRLDGFVLEFTAEPYATDLARFSQSINRILRTLAAHDPSGRDCFADDPLSEDWQFTFNGTRFFITTFAPFYGVTHSRYSHSNDSAFIYLQPEYSFDHHGISPTNPGRRLVKKRIREAFLEGGSPYNVDLIIQPHEAYKYVKPLALEDSPVCWWEAM